jgi:hypothetical protein
MSSWPDAQFKEAQGQLYLLQVPSCFDALGWQCHYVSVILPQLRTKKTR